MTKHDRPPATSVSAFSQGSLEEPSLDEALPDGQRPVVIASFQTPMEAELARGRLDAYGIRADLLDLHTVSLGAPLALAVGGVKLRVLHDDAERARELLSARALDADDDGDDDDDDSEALAPAADGPEALAGRALSSSVIGAIFLPPLALYSLWLVWRALTSRSGPLSKKARNRLVGAVGFDLVALSWVALLLSSL